MDTNPFAMSPNTPQQPRQTPSYLQQEPSNGSWAGGISNMVKALMDGNAQYRQRQQAQGLGQARVAEINAAKAAGQPVGPPLSLAPPAAISNVRAPQAASPFDVGAAPVQPSPIPYDPTATQIPMPQVGGLPGMPNAVGNVDPSMRALFSQIPGEGSQFGG